jgi:hypothetical protein
MLRFRFLAALVLGAACSITRAAAAAAPASSPVPAPAEEWTPGAEAIYAPHHFRSLIEMGAGLALGLGGYWVFKNDNVTDWDNPQLAKRFSGAAWTFDNNSVGVNFLGHPLEGALAYSFARANHQSVLGSFAYGFTTSFIWEFVFEFKEKVSINDVLVTPGAGLPLGEFFYKLGLYLDTGHHDSIGVAVLRGLVGNSVALDRALDGRAAPRVTTRDNLGFSSQIWHEFAARYGVLAVASRGIDSYALYRLGLSAKLVTLQGYGRPGHVARGFYGAEISSLSATAEASRYGSGVAVAADTVLVGYHRQDLERRAGVLQGTSLTFGSSVGYDYLRSEANRYGSVERAVAEPRPKLDYHVPNRREQYGAVQLPGIGADFGLLGSWGGLSATCRLQPSFAGLSAAAFYDWAAANRDQINKHILHRQGYFYGWGGVLSAGLQLRVGPLRGGFELSYAAYRSQNGADREQDEVTDDVAAIGSLLRYRGALGVTPGDGPVNVALELSGRRFYSRVGRYERNAAAVQRGISATWTF